MDEMTIPLLEVATPGSEVLIQTFWDRLIFSTANTSRFGKYPDLIPDERWTFNGHKYVPDG
ncbi:hypothetical protein [Brevibacillus agri]